MNGKDKKNLKGQSLFEILFALAVMAMIGVAVVSLSVSAVRNNIYANNKTLANKYNLEGQEWLRNMRDNGFQEVWDHSKNHDSDFFHYCVEDVDTHTWANDGPCDPTNDLPISGTKVFYRTVSLRRVDLVGGGERESVSVVIKVEWTDGQGDHTSVSETYLTNWKIQTW